MCVWLYSKGVGGWKRTKCGGDYHELMEELWGDAFWVCLTKESKDSARVVLGPSASTLDRAQLTTWRSVRLCEAHEKKGDTIHVCELVHLCVPYCPNSTYLTPGCNLTISKVPRDYLLPNSGYIKIGASSLNCYFGTFNIVILPDGCETGKTNCN